MEVEELATAMRKSEGLSFSASIERAIDMVAKFDANGDGELDKQEFHSYVSSMVKEMDLTASEFAEYMIVHLHYTKETEKPDEKLKGELVVKKYVKEYVKEEVKKRQELFAILKNEKVEKAFAAFDPASTGKVSFRHIAHGLYERTQSMNEGVQEAMKVLLMMEKNDERMLNYEQFGRLLLAVSKTADLTLDDLHDSLLKHVADMLNNNKRDETVGEKLVIDNASAKEASSHTDLLTYARLQKLFKLWDADGSGSISVAELSDGLGGFQKASGIKVDPDRVAQALLCFDEDGDNELGPREFAHAMVHYAKQFGVEISGLIDAMVLLSSKKYIEMEAENLKDDFQEIFGPAAALLSELKDVGDETTQSVSTFWTES